MGDEDESDLKPAEKDAGRMEAFSDAVMAVIMTIMAFQLKPPQGTDLAAIGGQLHGLFVYVLSFAFIGIYWNNHHHLLRTARRISAGAMWANLLLLFWLSLAPVLTEWLRVYYRYPLPAAAYGLMALAAGFSYLLLVHALIRANGPESAVAKAIGSDFKGYASLALYAAGVLLAFVSPWISYTLYAAVAIMWILPDRRLSS